MKNIRSFDEFINEGISFKKISNANLVEIGGNYANNAEPSNHSRNELEEMALEVLRNAKPIPLTGNVKTDAEKLIKYIADQCKRAGIVLDSSNSLVYSPDFENEIEIPVIADGIKDRIFFQTYLDYNELATNGSDFVLTGAFSTYEMGTMDNIITDLSNYGMYVKAAEELKTYMNTQKNK